MLKYIVCFCLTNIFLIVIIIMKFDIFSIEGLHLYTVVDMYLAEQLSLWLLDKHETSPICNLCPTVSKNGQTPTMKYTTLFQTLTMMYKPMFQTYTSFYLIIKQLIKESVSMTLEIQRFCTNFYCLVCLSWYAVIIGTIAV